MSPAILRNFLLAFAAAAPAPAWAAACDAPQTNQGVIDTEMRWAQALEARDAAALDEILEPGFVETTWRRETVNRRQILTTLPQRPAITIHLSELRASVVGGRAVVQGLNTQKTPGGRTIGTVSFTDNFVYRAGCWRAVSAREVLKN